MAKKTVQSFWESIIKSAIEKKMFQETAIDNLLRPLIPIKYMDGILVLETINNFAPQILNHRYLKKLNEIAKESDKDFLSMKFIIARETEETQQNEKSFTNVQTIPKNALKKNSLHIANPQYTFDEFIETYENRLAVASARGIANMPGKMQNYNPFFVYGKAGVGKTHIIHAIANEIYKNNPQTNLVLTSGKMFYINFSSNLSKSTYDDFERIFNEANVIIFDNIDELTGKTEAQLELYKIFNKFHLLNKQMVFTASCAPSELIGFNERIITRLQWGLTVKLDMQNHEARTAILANMVKKSRIKLSNEEITYIVDNCSDNIHELKGIVVNIAASTSLNRSTVTQETIQEALKSKNLEPIKGYLPPKKILDVICSYYKIDLLEQKSKSRIAHIAYGRQIAIYFLNKHTTLSLQAIGEHLGGKNHSTILHSVNKIKNKMKSDLKLSKELKDISNILFKN